MFIGFDQDTPSYGSNVDAWSFNQASEIIITKHPAIECHLLEFGNNVHVSIADIQLAGGGETGIAKKATSFFRAYGAREKKYPLGPQGKTKIVIRDEQFDCETHKFDCCFPRVPIEMEWNNKDAFFERDIHNLRRLHELGMIDAGVIITRSKNFDPLFKQMSRRGLISGTKILTSHTDHKKLISMICKGVGSCPILALAINQNGVESL